MTRQFYASIELWDRRRERTFDRIIELEEGEDLACRIRTYCRVFAKQEGYDFGRVIAICEVTNSGK